MSNINSSNLKIIVVGLPRSGTSFLTNFISLMGFSLGNKDWLKKPDQYNLDGYFECLPLNSITNRLLCEMGCDFHHNLPSTIKLDAVDINKYSTEIYDLINSGNIEIYKDNKLTIMPDIYDKLFPNVHWVYIERSVFDTYKSRFGGFIEFNDWVDISNNRRNLWLNSAVSKKALTLNYSQFETNLSGCLDLISEHLNVKLTEDVRHNCLSLFRLKNSVLTQREKISGPI